MFYMNIYRVGVYHRAGKPETCNRHGGDIYCSEEAALRHIEHGEHYICTVPVPYIGEGEVEVFPEDSRAVPLSQTRRLFVIINNGE